MDNITHVRAMNIPICSVQTLSNYRTCHYFVHTSRQNFVRILFEFRMYEFSADGVWFIQRFHCYCAITLYNEERCLSARGYGRSKALSIGCVLCIQCTMNVYICHKCKRTVHNIICIEVY